MSRRTYGSPEKSQSGSVTPQKKVRSKTTFNRVGVPNSERFLDISYYSILLNIFFPIFFSESIHLMFCLSVPGAKRPRVFIFLGRFAPFFLMVRVFRIRARVPNSEHFTSF